MLRKPAPEAGAGFTELAPMDFSYAHERPLTRLRRPLPSVAGRGALEASVAQAPFSPQRGEKSLP